MAAVRRGAVAVSVAALVAACGNSGPGTPDRDTGEVTLEVASLAAQVMDMAGVKGRTTEGAPPIDPDESSCDPDDMNSARRHVEQFWSLYGVGDGPLGPAMARLGAGLPKHGWKVLYNGPREGTAARDPEIEARHAATGTLLVVEWNRGRPHEEASIVFDVYSRCFRDSAAV
jgi:hypothetical protein